LKHAFTLAALVLAVAACTTPETKQEQPAKAAAAPAAPAAKAACANPVPPPSELVAKDLEPGTGDTVRFRTAVLMSYTGWLYDGCQPDFKGEMFDTSEAKPSLSFMVGVGKMIRGWDEGVIGMKEGGKRLLVIPPDKGYGAAGAPGKIPPNSTLVFVVHVDKIIAQPPQ
jgi:FKBP-type peptidyl-prolyl cis-trans isomerase